MEVFGGFHHVGFYVNVFRTFIQWHAKKMVSKSIAAFAIFLEHAFFGL